MENDLEGSGRSPISLYYPDIHMESVNKITENLIYGSHQPDRDLNLVPTNHKVTAAWAHQSGRFWNCNLSVPMYPISIANVKFKIPKYRTCNYHLRGLGHFPGCFASKCRLFYTYCTCMLLKIPTSEVCRNIK
jgi:hypothetical protein